MSRTKLNEMLERYSALNGAGSIKNANAMIPEMFATLLSIVDGSEAPATTKARTTGTELEVDPLAMLSEEEQAAYVEACFRKRGYTNHGAAYSGKEELVEKFMNELDAPKTCAPCEVKEDGTSAVTELVQSSLDAVVNQEPVKRRGRPAGSANKAAPKKRPAK